MNRIFTKYQGPTDFKGSYIVAREPKLRRQLSMAYQYELSSSQNHEAAAQRLADKLKIGKLMMVESLETGYVFERDCRGAGVGCDCGRDHGEGSDRGEWNHV
jgi:hypothetical protein